MYIRMSFIFGIFSCCIPFIVLSGCGKGYVPMSGTVTFADDGSPLTTGTVCFETDKFFARGELDKNGRYTLGYDKTAGGLPKGTYQVCIVGAVTMIGDSRTQGSNAPRFRSLIDTKYRTAGTSGLVVVVDGTEKTRDFSVDRYKPGK